MIVTDPGITGCILKVVEQYNTNIATRFIRPLLAGILSEPDISRPITDMTEQTETLIAQGIHLDELYQQILAMSRFIYRVRLDILPNLRNIAGYSSSANDMNKIYRDMAMNNFGANIQVLADYIYELYLKTVEYDKRVHEGRKTVCHTMPELSEIGRYLIQK